jgi:hypothetical protein
LVPADEVESQYQYSYCEFTNFDGNTTVCLSEGFRTELIKPFQPPFLYNNLCTSTILTKYIPVYVFVYSIQLFVSILMVVLLTSVVYTSLPRLLRKGLHGVFWPNHEWVSSGIVPRDILKAPEIISFDILSHLAIFLTFGISCPYLVLILIFSVCLKLYMWRVVIGRFVFVRSSLGSNSGGVGGSSDCGDGISNDDGLTTLSVACLPILDMLEDCIWPIVLSSAVFFAFVCWDMAGDVVGWRKSFWAPVTVLLFPLFLLGCLRLRASGESELSELTSSSLSSNPMQNYSDDVELRRRI